MSKIRKYLFILNYLGSLLIILSTFMPIISFNNQKFLFIDQYLTLSIVIGFLSTITIIITTMKKYKLSIIPTIMNALVIAYGIYKIFTLDNLNMMNNVSYEIAVILYPIGILCCLLGGFFTKNTGIEEKINITQDNVTNSENKDYSLNDIHTNFEESEQIPLDNLININDVDNNNNYNNDSYQNSESIQEVNNTIKEEDTPNNLFTYNVNNLEKNNDIVSTDVSFNDNNQIEENIPKNIETTNLDQNIPEDIETTNLDQNIPENIETTNLDQNIPEDIKTTNEDQNILEDIEITNLDENNNFEDNIDDNLLFMDDINDNANIIENNNNYFNNNNEIPDIDEQNNIMMNNTQIEDTPKQEYMAINPSDIKINEKNSFFNKNKKSDIDPIEKIMNRKIPTTLGRKCQFCNTLLGDDERICPLCGRIN